MHISFLFQTFAKCTLVSDFTIVSHFIRHVFGALLRACPRTLLDARLWMTHMLGVANLAEPLPGCKPAIFRPLQLNQQQSGPYGPHG